MIIKMIAAVSQNGVFGDADTNDIPWRGKYQEDFKFFRQMTAGGAVIFGRRTFESIGKPLPKRTNIVITRQEKIEGTYCFPSLEAWVKFNDLRVKDQEPTNWLCGGAGIYNEGMKHASEIYLTLIPEEIKVNNPVMFPWIDPTKFNMVELIKLENSDLKVAKYIKS